MNDRGSAPLELALGVLLVLVPAAVLVLSFAPWLEARVFLRSAASEAGRLVAVDGDEDAARDMVADMAGNMAIDPATVRIGFCGLATPLDAPPASTCLQGGRPARSGVVVVRVEVEVAGVHTPFGQVGGIVSAHEHAEPVDTYRSLG